MNRRRFLRHAALGPVLLAGGSGLFAACENAASSTQRDSPGFELARPNHPLRLTVHDDVPPIAEGLEPEAGPLRIYNWKDYIRPQVIRRFERRFGVDVKVTTFANMQEALAVLRHGVSFDLFFHRIDVLGRLVAAKLLRPLNHAYLPNFRGNAWPVYRQPFYDLGSRYTVPYTVYTTGIGWRTDKVPDDLAAMENPYEIFWDARYKGRIHLMNDYREVVSLVLLKNSITDLNTDDAEALATAGRDLSSLRSNVARLDIDAYSDIPTGEAWIHQAWSGDMLAAPYYFAKGGNPSVLRYWFPPDGGGAVANDVMGIMRQARNPVLAHHFVNHLFDEQVSLDNFVWNGYQPPLSSLDANDLRKGRLVPSYLASTLVRRRSFNLGSMQLELSPSADRAWRAVYSSFSSGLPGGVAQT